MFEWFAEVLRLIAMIVPRLIIIKATHGGVKWRRGHTPIAMKPGIWWYWPVTTECEIIVTARQTLELPTQALQTLDKKAVVVGSIVVYSVSDVVQAMGNENWDVDTTINDIAQTAVVEVITSATLEELSTGISKAVRRKLTARVRKRLAGFGVRVHGCALTNFSESRVLNLMGVGQHKHQSTITTIKP